MSLPIMKTVKRNIQRVYFDWPVIWHFMQVPLLLCGLANCLMIAAFLLIDNSVFYTIDPENQKEMIKPTIWYYVFLFSTVAAGWLSFTPFVVSWSRYVAAGESAMQGRPFWVFAQQEWHYIWGGIKLVLWSMLVGGGVGLAISIPVVMFALAVSGMELSARLQISLAIIGGLIAVSLFVWVIGRTIRWSIALIPVAFGAPLDLALASQVTEGRTGKILVIYAFLSSINFVPLTLVTLAFQSQIDSSDVNQLLHLFQFQMLQPILFLPLGIFSNIISIAFFSDLWRLPAGRGKWPVAEFPLLLPPETDASVPPQSS